MLLLRPKLVLFVDQRDCLEGIASRRDLLGFRRGKDLRGAIRDFSAKDE
jgi:hypothetical protein